MKQMIPVMALALSGIASSALADDTETPLLLDPAACNEANLEKLQAPLGSIFYIAPENNAPFLCVSACLYKVKHEWEYADVKPLQRGAKEYYYCKSDLPSCRLENGVIEQKAYKRTDRYITTTVKATNLNPKFNKVFRYATSLGHNPPEGAKGPQDVDCK